MENDGILKIIEDDRNSRHRSFDGESNRRPTDDERIALFMLALRLKDGRITEKALEMLEWYRWSDNKLPEDDWRNIVFKWAEFGYDLRWSIIDRKDGPDGKTIVEKFNPFSGTPGRILEELRKLEKVRPGVEAVRDFVRGICSFLGKTGKDGTVSGTGERLIADARAFLASWLEDVPAILWDNEQEFFQSDYEEGKDGFDELVTLLALLAEDEGFSTFFDSVLDFTSHSLTRCGCREDYGYETQKRNWMEPVIRSAIRNNNLHSLEKLLECADENDDTVVIDTYPGTLSVLAPVLATGRIRNGSRRAEAAFFNLIGSCNPDKEVIILTMHPAYLRRSIKDKPTPIITAVKNPMFSPRNYRLLIQDENDLNIRRGLTPLGYAYLRGDRQTAEELVSLGADTGWKDGDGNNIVHYLLSLEGVSLVTLAEVVPPELFNEKNRAGETPLDLYYSGEKVDFGEDYNAKRTVEEI